MFTLGINAVYHDLAACLVKDGCVIAAAEEERFTRKKHGKRPIPFSTYELPYYAIDYCLKEAEITLKDVEHVAYSYDPYLLLGNHSKDTTIELPLEPSAHPKPEEFEAAWDPLFLSSIVNAPRQLSSGAPHHLQARFRGTSPSGPYRWHFVQHHLAHGASAFLPSPFQEAAIFTIDGRGEQATTTYAHGIENTINFLGQVNMPHSLGILYEQITEYLGFLNSSDEYKVMALASYGKPIFLKEFRDHIHIQKNGQYTIDPIDLEDCFGPQRIKGDPFEQRHYDVAHSLQIALEETVLELLDWLREATQSDRLAMAGGVALNCVMNARIRDRGPFKDVWVQPAAGDAGTALGAALWVDAQERKSEERCFQMDHAFLGPEYSEKEIESFLSWSKLPYRRSEDIAKETAEMLAQNKIIGWFQGRLEFGPRALGARSILASPIDAKMQDRLNDIKDREDFRPVAPVVLEEEAGKWFINAQISPFMLFVYDVNPEKAASIPAVRHVDGTARIQTINRDQNPPYYDLLNRVLCSDRRSGAGEYLLQHPRRADRMLTQRCGRMFLDLTVGCACYWTVYFRKGWSRRMKYFVSIVVPTYNRPKLLERCLIALLNQDYDPARYEILVVDDAVNPETQAIVEQIYPRLDGDQLLPDPGYRTSSSGLEGDLQSEQKADRQPWQPMSFENGPRIPYIPVRYIPVTGCHGPSAARNCGWRAAEGQVIAFTDDDCIPWPTWLSAGVAAFRKNIAGVSGQVIVPISASPSDYELDTQGLERSDFVTANCFYLKSVLEEVGGFDEDFKMAWREDSDLYFTLLERGHSLVSSPAAIVIYPVRPPKWGVSLGQQKKSMYNALLFKKHPDLYRKKIQAKPPLRYYSILFTLMVGLLGLLTGIVWIGYGCLLAWLIITLEFFESRLEHTSHAIGHLVEMLLTSFLIPPLAVYWRLRGAIQFRTLFY